MADEQSVPAGVRLVQGRADEQFEAIRHALAERRRALGMSMSELARHVGVSPSMVSQIERGLTQPSVATLFALAAALGATVDTFFSEPGPGNEEAPHRAMPRVDQANAAEAERPGNEGLYVVREGRRSGVDIRGGVRWEMLTAAASEGLEFLELIYGPHAESDAELYRHPGVEMVLVLEGRFRIHIGFDAHDLDVGDSIAFPSSLPHRYVNPTSATARAVTVILREPLSTLPAASTLTGLGNASDLGKTVQATTFEETP